MKDNSINTDLDSYENLTIEELQTLAEELSSQLKAAKQALRDKRLAGVNLAIAAKREADAELNEELRKLGYPSRSSSFMLADPLTTLRNLRF